MSGYVCSIKPLKLAREGKPEEARKAIASSALRRLIRLPATTVVVTTISWFLDRLGAFNVAKSLPSYTWMHLFSPPQFSSFYDSVVDLWRSNVRSLCLDIY
jgi:hypothetical protein